MVVHRRGGKALDIETPIPMADGSWKKMGRLRDGDRVLDERGQPCNVVAAHPVTLGRPCYEVVFSDGATIICDEDHLWSTQSKLDRAKHKFTKKGPRGASIVTSRVHAPRKPSPKTTAEIRETLTYQGENNHSIDCCGPVEYPIAPLPIDPYVFGAWLGDGTSRAAHITSMDEEIVSEFQAYATAKGLKMDPTTHQNAGRATTWKITGDRHYNMVQTLNQMGVLNNKHIPKAYLAASKEQRIALLQGLMDTDGSTDDKSKCEITQKRRELADQIVQLLNSLGEKAVVRRKVINSRDYFRIGFRSAFNPFRLRRKADRWAPHVRDEAAHSRRRFIVAVNPVPSRPVRCITVDSPNSLYLCGKQYIPTHNTVAAINDLIRAAVTCKSPMPLFGYVAPFRSQAKKVAWEYLKTYAKPIIKPGGINEAELEVRLMNGAKIALFGADNADAMRGLGMDGIVLDEYGDYKPSVWGSVIRPLLSDKQGWALFIGTPKGKNQFWDIFQTARLDPAEWYCLSLPASKSGILPSSELNAVRMQITEDQYMQEYEVSFEAAILGAYYGKEMRIAADEKRIGMVPYDPALKTYTAWDLGYRDDTAIWWYQAVRGEIHVIDYHAVSGASIAEISKTVLDKPYHYAKHFLPHDAKAKTLAAAGKAVIEQLATHLGMENLAIVPDLSLQDGIQAVRQTLKDCWFDEVKCREGIEALRQYEREYDEDRKAFRQVPKHNWTSHPADAFRMLSIAFRNEPQSYVANPDRPLIVGPGNQSTLNDMWAAHRPRKRGRI